MFTVILNLIFVAMAITAWVGAEEKKRDYEKRIKKLENQFDFVLPAIKEANEIARQITRMSPEIQILIAKIPDIRKAVQKLEEFDRTY